MSTPKSVTASTGALQPEGWLALPLSLKFSIFDKTARWETIEVGRLLPRLAQLDPSDLAAGVKGVWLRAWYELPEQGKGYFPWLDIEHPDDHHKSIEANLDTARELAERMARLELLDHLVVGLSGSGVRFALPWACEPAMAAGFEGFLRDRARFPGIDSSPQLKGQHFRWTAYRGNRLQVQVPGKGKPPTTRDIHVHFLDHAADLLTLTEARYRELTAGRPDPERMLEDVRRCLPTAWTPEPWRELLDDYARDARLRRHVVRVRLPKPPEAERRNGPPEAETILAELASRGIRAREMVVKGTPAWRLSACPVCGKGEGNPTLYASGWLHDFRATCPAGETTDLGKGLPWRVWARLAGLEQLEGHQAADDDDVVDPRHETPPDAMTVDQARRAIREALASDDPALLVKIPAGVGKSHAALEHALDVAQDGVVLLTVPTTALAEELATKARQMAQDKGLDRDVRQYRGRSKETCSQADYCATVASFGYSPALLVCARCMSRDDCQHFHQLEGLENGVVVAAHAAAPFVLPKIKGRLREWIVDESPLRDLFRHELVYQGSFTALKARLVGAAETAMEKIEATAEKLLAAIPAQGGGQGRLYATTPPPGDWESTMDLWEAAGITEDEREALSGQLAYWDQLHGEKPGAWQRRLWDEKLDLALLNWLWLGLGEKGQGSAYVRCLPHPTNPITFRALRNQVPTLPDHVRLVALDATGDERELEALFSRPFRVVDAAVELPPARRVWLRQAMGKWATGRLLEDPKKTETLFRKAVANLRPQDRRVLLVTHLDAEPALVELAKRVDPSREWASTHYWASRGLDCWRDHDAVLAFGTPTANRAGLLDLELALFGADQAARDKWFASLGPRDLTQAANRIRPVLSPKTIVIVGREWPTESLSAPSFTLDFRRQGGAAEAVEMAYRRLLPLADKYGLMFSELAALAGVFRAEDKAGLDDWMERVQPWTGGESPPAIVPTLIREVLIRVGTMGEVLSPIQFKRRTDWSQLMARLADATGLPDLEYRPRSAHGGGRGQAALGYLTSVRRICAKLGVAYDPTLWEGQARPTAPPDWLTFPAGAFLQVDGQRVDAGTIFPVEDPDAPPARLLAAAAPG